MTMNRREFLRKAGVGSVALATLPAFVDRLAIPVQAADGTSFYFLAQTAAGPAGTPAAPQHRLAMGGAGTFDAGRPGSAVAGGGTYTHFLFPGSNPRAGEPPLTVVASGSWEARLLVSYRQIGTWGVAASGLAEMVIDLFREVPTPAIVRGARLKIVCNVGQANLTTGEPEGYFLSVPGTDFFTGGTPGPFAPLTPPVGVTVFSTLPFPS